MPSGPDNPSPRNNKTLPELFEILQPHLKALDAFLLQQVSSFEKEIQEHVAYSIDTGGKRIRPSLIFFSGWGEDGAVNPDLVKLSAIIEIIHLATLVHDDIMDGADMRRSRDTVARKYGNETAVLLGDALFSHAVFLATQFPTSEVCREIAASMRQVCTGEILQTMQRGDPNIDLPTYYRVIDLKTAELFRVSCHLGARLAKESDGFTQAAGEFGRRLGIAYQIYDDLTDLFGSQEKIGKTLGTDLATGKATLPLIWLRQRLPAAEADELRQTLAGEQESNIRHWLARLDELGVFDEVKSEIFRVIDEGIDAVRPFSDRNAAQYLLTISQLLRNQVKALQSSPVK